MRILLIEDDQHICDFLVEGFEEQGEQITCCYDGREGLQEATQGDYQLIILDLMLPSLDGMSVLKRIRGEGHQVPIIILSARHTVEEKVIGIQSGADDYMVKPFAFAELSARCQMLLRRKPTEQISNTLSYRDLSMDLITRQLFRNEKAITLTQREFKLIQLFMQQPERVFSKTIILENIWGYQFNPQTNVVDVLVCRLRAHVDKGFDEALIHTIRGVGYVLKTIN